MGQHAPAWKLGRAVGTFAVARQAQKRAQAGVLVAIGGASPVRLLTGALGKTLGLQGPWRLVLEAHAGGGGGCFGVQKKCNWENDALGQPAGFI